MKKDYLVSENFEDYLDGDQNLNENIDSSDLWGDEDSLNIETLDMEEEDPNIKIEDNMEEEKLENELLNIINNELEAPEFSRAILTFRLKGQQEEIEGIPMASLQGGKSFLFKINGQLKKINLEDMILESVIEEKGGINLKLNNLNEFRAEIVEENINLEWKEYLSKISYYLINKHEDFIVNYLDREDLPEIDIVDLLDEEEEFYILLKDLFDRNIDAEEAVEEFVNSYI